MAHDVFQTAHQCKTQGRKFVIAVVVEAKGSVPRKPGARMLYSADGEQVGTIGGGELEADVIERSKRMLATGAKPALVEYDLDSAEGPTCGGKVKVFIEPILPEKRLLIFGAGHVAAALAGLMSELGWQITVFDYRSERLAMPEFAKCNRIQAPFSEASTRAPFAADQHIIVMTPEHRFDFEVVQACIDKPWASLGVLGSKHKRRQLMEALDKIGAPQTFKDSIRIPVGVPIKSETPLEIAVSIAAELIDLESKRKRNLRNG